MSYEDRNVVLHIVVALYRLEIMSEKEANAFIWEVKANDK
jgi:hypothetical protein